MSHFLVLQELLSKELIDLDSFASSCRECAVEWRLNDKMETLFSNVKLAVKALSDTCTKLTLISSMSQEDSTESILLELTQAIDLISISFLQLRSECQLCKELALSTVSSLRCIYSHVIDLIRAISRSDTDRATIRMTWKVCEDMAQLPVSNKAAYRRHYMKHIAAVKDTIEEFDGYVTATKLDLSQLSQNVPPTGNGNDDDDDDVGLDDKFTVDEIPEVEGCIATLRLTFDCLKIGLQIMTFIADAVDKSQSHTQDVEIEFVTENRNWVVSVVSGSGKIGDSVVELGFALYPPLDRETVCARKRETLDAVRIFLKTTLRAQEKLFALTLGEGAIAALSDVEHRLDEMIANTDIIDKSHVELSNDIA